MLKLPRVAPHEWQFVYPDIYADLMSEFHIGCELYEEGKLDDAVRVFRAVLAQMPDHAGCASPSGTGSIRAKSTG